MPEGSRNLIGVPDASYLRPLLYGLRDAAVGLDLLVDIPSQLAIKLQQRTDSLRCVFLSPMDYARHGGDYLIVPGVGVSSSSRSDTITLFINPNVRNIETIAVDIRVTSEIILAKIVLAERFPNLASDKRALQFIPMLPDPSAMLRKADAALIVNFHPRQKAAGDPFAVDLVEEWTDLTGLPYVHGVWVGHDESEAESIVPDLVRAQDEGISHLEQIAGSLSAELKQTTKVCRDYLSNFTYKLEEEEREGFAEFTRYAYYHGALQDVPDLNFFDVVTPPPESVN